MSWILTNSAKPMSLVRPRADLVTTTDIAHSLAHICRFNGHCKHHYSVAQHSLLVASIVPEKDQLPALLHDAAEAYVGDMVRPLKQLLLETAASTTTAWLLTCFDLGTDRHTARRAAEEYSISPGGDPMAEHLNHLASVYHQIEQRVWLAIAERFDIDPEQPASVHKADMVALATERRDLMPEHAGTWECLNGYDPLPQHITRWTPEEARQRYHDRLLELLATTHRARTFAKAEHDLMSGTGTGSPVGLFSYATERQV